MMPTLPVACRSDVGALGRGLRLGLDVRGRLPNLVTDEDDAAGEDYKAVKGAEDDANDDARDLGRIMVTVRVGGLVPLSLMVPAVGFGFGLG